MEINRFDEVIGVIPMANVKEGHFGLLTSHGFDNDFGSDVDLPGWKVPANTTEAKRAKFMLAWAQDNRDTPIYQTIPSRAFALRQGFDQSTNLPFSATVYVTSPSVQQGLTIPSGTKALAFGKGFYTLLTGEYIYSSSLATPGVGLTVQDATTDSTAGETGKLKYAAWDADVIVAIVERYNSDDGSLTVKVL